MSVVGNLAQYEIILYSIDKISGKLDDLSIFRSYLTPLILSN